MTKRKAKIAVVEPEVSLDASGLLAEARSSFTVMRRTNERIDGIAALEAVAKIVAASEPGSEIRRMTWRQIATRAASQDLTSSMMKWPRWPNGNETLVI